MSTAIESILGRVTPQQEAIIKHEERELFVAAGAGTGKTSTITKKVAYLMEAKDKMAFEEISNLLAITFTRKAAGELTSRLRRILKEAGRPDDAKEVDSAWVSTIHSMCARILRDCAFELGVDPGFQICADEQVIDLRTQAIDHVLENGDVEKYAQLFDGYKVAGTQYSPKFSVTGIEYALLEKLGTIPGSDPDSFDVGPAPRSFRAMGQDLLQAYRDYYDALLGIAGPNDATCDAIYCAKERVNLIEDALRRADSEGHSEERTKADLCLIFNEAFDLKSLSTRQGNADVKAAIREAKAALFDLELEANLAVAYPCIAPYLEMSKEVLDKYRELKHERGAMDNNDLLYELHRALELYPNIRERYADQFKLILIDEFQDTDLIQMGIARLLTEASDTNALVTVGDAQQSIYRFRGADVGLFKARQAEVPGANQKTMDVNFRSHGAVIDYVNTVFGSEAVFGEDGAYIRLEASEFTRDRGENIPRGEPRVEILMTTTSASTKECASSADVKRIEALRIASRFKHYRDLGYSANDMALLLRSLNDVEEYVDVLREVGFEVIITGGTLFWKQAEPLLVSQILKLLANPLNNEAAYHVLASPLFGLEDNDFAMLIQKKSLGEGGKSFRLSLYEALFNDDDVEIANHPRLVRARTLLSHAFDGLDLKRPSRIIRTLVEESGYAETLDSEGIVGVSKAGNLLKALRYVESLEEDSDATCATVSFRYARLMKSDPKDAPGVLFSESREAISVMTLHASKGLEFPIVALGGFDKSTSVDDKFMIEAIDRVPYLGLKADKAATWPSLAKAAYDAKHLYAGVDLDLVGPIAKGLIPDEPSRLRYHMLLKAYRKYEETEEKRRLFYVGATRAQDALILAIHPKVSIKVNKKTGDKEWSFEDSVIRQDMQRMFAEGVFPIEDGLHALDEGNVLSYSYFYVEKHSVEEDFARIYREVMGKDYAKSSGKDLPVLPEAHTVPAVVRQLESADFYEFSYSSLPEYKGRDYVRHAAERKAGRSGEKPSREEREERREEALSLGLAFHGCMEYLVRVGGMGKGRLEPVSDAVAALMSRRQRLDEEGRARLSSALASWHASSFAKEVAAYDNVFAETPFYLLFDASASSEGESDGRRALAEKPVYITGHMDLMCWSGDSSEGFPEELLIVDYKTGGSQYDSVPYLEKKHRMQADCYAFAAIERGAKRVEIRFACMEHLDDSGEPLVIRYSYACGEKSDVWERVAQGWLRKMKRGKDEPSRGEVRAALGMAGAPDARASAPLPRSTTPRMLKLEYRYEGIDRSSSAFSSVCREAQEDVDLEAEVAFLEELAERGDELGLPAPCTGAYFEDSATGKVAETLLAWAADKTVLLDQASCDQITDDFGPWLGIEGWRVLTIADSTIDEVAAALRG